MLIVNFSFFFRFREEYVYFDLKSTLQLQKMIEVSQNIKSSVEYIGDQSAIGSRIFELKRYSKMFRNYNPNRNIQQDSSPFQHFYKAPLHRCFTDMLDIQDSLEDCLALSDRDFSKHELSRIFETKAEMKIVKDRMNRIFDQGLSNSCCRDLDESTMKKIRFSRKWFEKKELLRNLKIKMKRERLDRYLEQNCNQSLQQEKRKRKLMKAEAKELQLQFKFKKMRANWIPDENNTFRTEIVVPGENCGTVQVPAVHQGGSEATVLRGPSEGSQSAVLDEREDDVSLASGRGSLYQEVLPCPQDLLPHPGRRPGQGILGKPGHAGPLQQQEREDSSQSAGLDDREDNDNLASARGFHYQEVKSCPQGLLVWENSIKPASVCQSYDLCEWNQNRTQKVSNSLYLVYTYFYCNIKVSFSTIQ